MSYANLHLHSFFFGRHIYAAAVVYAGKEKGIRRGLRL